MASVFLLSPKHAPPGFEVAVSRIVLKTIGSHRSERAALETFKVVLSVVFQEWKCSRIWIKRGSLPQ